MNIVFITGSHPRHAYVARQLAKTGLLTGCISEQREAFVPEPPPRLSPSLTQLFIRHFALREQIEAEKFGAIEWPACEHLEVALEELNDYKVHDFLRRHDPDLLLSYGCHMISSETLQCVRGEAWNCHGGLSPWYKGAITHFWPSYLLEPQMTGMTIHDLTDRLDAGAIVHQCAADLVAGDGLHALAARAVLKMGDELPRLVQHLAAGQTICKNPQRSNGMLWLNSKWRPEHLRLIYEDYHDRIVDHYLEGDFEQREPKLHRQF